jgi:hypothetical protein
MKKQRQRQDTLLFFQHSGWKNLSRTKAVSDRDFGSEHVVGFELNVVLDVVVVNLRSHKELAPNPETNTASEVLHKVIAAGVVNAPGTGTARIGVGQVEAGGRNADPTHKVEANLPSSDFAHTRLKECVNVGKNRAVGLTVVWVISLPISPGGFKVKAEPAFSETNKVSVDADKCAALLDGWGESYQVAGTRRCQ